MGGRGWGRALAQEEEAEKRPLPFGAALLPSSGLGELRRFLPRGPAPQLFWLPEPLPHGLSL